MGFMVRRARERLGIPAAQDRRLRPADRFHENPTHTASCHGAVRRRPARSAGRLDLKFLGRGAPDRACAPGGSSRATWPTLDGAWINLFALINSTATRSSHPGGRHVRSTRGLQLPHTRPVPLGLGHAGHRIRLSEDVHGTGSRPPRVVSAPGPSSERLPEDVPVRRRARHRPLRPSSCSSRGTWRGSPACSSYQPLCTVYPRCSGGCIVPLRPGVRRGPPALVPPWSCRQVRLPTATRHETRQYSW
jgi:hypothetical protein